MRKKMINGNATPQGTSLFVSRFSNNSALDFYSKSKQGLFLSSIGIESEYFVNFSNQKCHYSGISLVNATKITSLENLDENYIIIDDKRIAFNLNTKQDYDLLSTT